MNIRLVLEALRQLRIRSASEKDPDARLSFRVASRYLMASLGEEYDRFLRLQVLEGAANVPVDRWWKKGKMGFTAAAKAFEGDPLDPAWLNGNQASGMYGILNRIARSALHKYGVPFEPFDLLNNALMGIPLDASRAGEGERTLRPPFEAGKLLSDAIREGKETPESVAKGLLGKFIERKVSNEAKRVREHLPEDDEGRVRDIPQVKTSPYGNVGMLLAAEMFGRGNPSPLSKALIGLVRKTWNTNKAWGPTMTEWLERTLNGEAIVLYDYALSKGISAQGFIQNHWAKAWNAFFKALKSSPQIIRALAAAADQVGLEWDPSDPIPFSAKDPMQAIRKSRPKRVKEEQEEQGVTSSTIQDRVIERWLT